MLFSLLKLDQMGQIQEFSMGGTATHTSVKPRNDSSALANVKQSVKFFGNLAYFWSALSVIVFSFLPC